MKMKNLIAKLSVAVILSFAATGIAFSDRIYDMGSGFDLYNSKDMSLVHLSLGSIKYSKERGDYLIGVYDPDTNVFTEEKSLLTTNISRAYLNRCAHYTSSPLDDLERKFQVDVLPDQVFCDKVEINQMYPNGEPYTIARDVRVDQWEERKPKPITPYFGKGFDDIIKQNPRAFDDQFRFLRMDVELSPMVVGHSRNVQFLKLDWNNEVTKKYDTLYGEYDGFYAVSHDQRSPTDYFDDNAADDIQQIICTAPLEQTNPGYFCEYYFPINAQIRARMAFIDFRLHGGREFARERIRSFKKTMCPIFHCDEQALRAAEVRGELK